MKRLRRDLPGCWQRSNITHTYVHRRRRAVSFRGRKWTEHSEVMPHQHCMWKCFECISDVRENVERPILGRVCFICTDGAGHFPIKLLGQIFGLIKLNYLRPLSTTSEEKCTSISLGNAPAPAPLQTTTARPVRLSATTTTCLRKFTHYFP